MKNRFSVAQKKKIKSKVDQTRPWSLSLKIINENNFLSSVFYSFEYLYIAVHFYILYSILQKTKQKIMFTKMNESE